MSFKGKSHSKETKKKISLSKTGNTIVWNKGIEWISRRGKNHHWFGRDNSDAKNPSYKGDNVGYRGLHLWVEKKLGKPTTCRHCGKTGLAGKKIHWANISKKYKRELTDWIRLCVPCHAIYDGNRGRKRIPQLVLS